MESTAQQVGFWLLDQAWDFQASQVKPGGRMFVPCPWLHYTSCPTATLVNSTCSFVKGTCHSTSHLGRMTSYSHAPPSTGTAALSQIRLICKSFYSQQGQCKTVNAIGKCASPFRMRKRNCRCGPYALSFASGGVCLFTCSRHRASASSRLIFESAVPSQWSPNMSSRQTGCK